MCAKNEMIYRSIKETCLIAKNVLLGPLLVFMVLSMKQNLLLNSSILRYYLKLSRVDGMLLIYV